MKTIDNLLNRITMYKLVLYVLAGLIAMATLLAWLGYMAFPPLSLLYSTAVITIVCWISNGFFARVWKTHVNVESAYITAFILALLISPPAAGGFFAAAPFLIWVSILAMASKYIFAITKKHIFNPVAFAVVITAFAINQSATWWIGTLYMLPFVLVGGLLVTRKIRRFDLVVSFFVAALIVVLATSGSVAVVPSTLKQIFVDSPIVFFALIMLTEPLTTPPTRFRRILYAAFTGLIFAPAVHLAGIYTTPELALCVGNVFSWILSPKSKYILTLKSKEKIAADTGEFVFSADRKISFKPGQYLEWTLGHRRPDSRGNRRYFTIASSPTENDIRLGVKFDAKNSSSFKKALAEMDEGSTLMAGQLAGDFTLPRNKNKKLCFVAGGIGVTPFRSMISQMLDSGQKRDVILIYSVRSLSELAYTDVISEAHEKIGLKTVSTLTDIDRTPADWHGHRGYVDAAMIASEVPDFMDRIFFISGPHSLVTAVSQVLRNIGVPSNHVKMDFFPGLA